jgi:glycosyltransferase involved in cell wall biosynthesis
MQLCEPSVTLAVCGDSANGYARSLRALADKLKLSDRVRFEGHIAGDVKERYFAESDVLVMPSFGESFGMSVAEALAHGVPVIASKGTPWSKIATVGCGLWVDNDPDSLSNAIKRIAKMPLREMGTRGREWMKHEFGWKQMASKTLACYRQAIHCSDENAV